MVDDGLTAEVDTTGKWCWLWTSPHGAQFRSAHIYARCQGT